MENVRNTKPYPARGEGGRGRGEGRKVPALISIFENLLLFKQYLRKLSLFFKTLLVNKILEFLINNFFRFSANS